MIVLNRSSDGNSNPLIVSLLSSGDGESPNLGPKSASSHVTTLVQKAPLIVRIDTSAFLFGNRNIHVIGNHLHSDNLIAGPQGLGFHSEHSLLIRW